MNSVASTVALINPDNNNDLMFGVYQPTIGVPSGPEFLTGAIDDIGIWNRALTQQEVSSLFLSTTQQPNCLVAYYPFTGNVADNSGNGNNGIVYGPALTTDRFGNTNCAYFFNKANIEYIEVNHSPTLDFLPEITLSLWTNIASYSVGGAGYNHFINKTDQSTDVQFVLASDTQGLYFYYGNHPLFFQTNTLPTLNQWHHLALTYKYDGTVQNSYCKFYVDGICTDSFPTTVSLNSTTYNLRIGSYSNMAYNTVDGKIDDVRIYSCALSDAEIDGIFTELEDLAEETNFSISPNPTSSIVIIHSNTLRQNTQLEIFNMLGEKIYTGVLNSGQQTVNCQLFPTGFYFVIVRGANGSLVRKFVVNR